MASIDPRCFAAGGPTCSPPGIPTFKVEILSLHAAERRRAIPKPEGNVQGLKPSQLNALNRLFNRRFPAEDVYTIEQARELALLSRALGRQVGLLIDRKGRVQMVLVGEAGSILIPELPRGRTGQERLRGLRLLHTHLSPDGISQEDLMDMLFLRLDAVIALNVNPTGDRSTF